MSDGKVNEPKQKEFNKPAKAKTHVFKEGDQLHKIATQNGISVGNLISFNDGKRVFKASEEIKLTQDGE